MPDLAQPLGSSDVSPVLDLDRIAAGVVTHAPFTYIVAHDVVSRDLILDLRRDFPDIERPGFLPVDTMPRHGVFDRLIRELESPKLAAILTRRLDVDLNDKPKIVTVRKWSEKEAGRIHVDGAAKIVTSLVYLNETWPEEEDGGRFRVLYSNRSFDDTAAEIPPVFGTFVAFVRTDTSWHGHKPFVGERRVVQTAWLKSQADFERKQKRGHLALFLKNLLGKTARG